MKIYTDINKSYMQLNHTYKIGTVRVCVVLPAAARQMLDAKC